MNSILARFSHKMNVSIAIALFALVGFFASHSAHAQQAAIETAGTVTEPLGDTYTEPQKLAPNAVRVTFYRPLHGYAGGVSSLKVNARYHTSLQFGGYSELCLSPGRVTLAARMVQNGVPLKKYEDYTAALSTKAGQNVFFRLNEYGDGRATITPVSSAVAQSELYNTRRQVHALSRVPNQVDCLPVEPRAVKKENITLGADALFAFGKSDIKDISIQGRASLDQLIAHLQKEYGNQDGVQIQIAGHADPLGSAAANKRLSEVRAQAIRSYMVQGGMNPKTISSIGLGSTQPLITTCGKTATPQTIECNKPNRRVVVSVQAVAR